MNEQQQEQRGEEARRILGDPIFKEAWEKVRERIVVKLESEEMTDAERLRQNDLLWALRAARKQIEFVAVTGTLVAMDTQRKRSIADRILRREY
jgi:hypothetical protein